MPEHRPLPNHEDEDHEHHEHTHILETTGEAAAAGALTTITSGMVSPTFLSNLQYINALVRGDSWSGSVNTSSVVNYTYGIATTLNDIADGLTSAGVLSSTQQSAMDLALQAWENVANIDFQLASTPLAANLMIRQANMPDGVAGWAASSILGDRLTTSDIVIDNPTHGTPTPGNFAFGTFLHEIGHAIGLKHPGNFGSGDTAPFLPEVENNLDLTIMSYNDGTYAVGALNPSTPMLYDIAAVQFLYGANTSFNSGDTVYHFDGSQSVQTYWDGGGNDTFNTSGYTGNVTIDLRAGVNNRTEVGSAHSWIAFNANIENATAGSGNDTISGNDLVNILTAGVGNDIVHALGGADILYGNLGTDQLYGNLGADTIFGGQSSDTLFGGQGADQLFGNVASDIIYGNLDNDRLFGGQNEDSIFGGIGADALYGNLGNDVLHGNRGNDVLFGGQGNDILFGGNGLDILHGNRGNDTLDGGGREDVYVFGPNTGLDTVNTFDAVGAATGDIIRISSAIYSSVAEIVSAITYANGNATISLGEGSSVTIIGIPDGAFTIEDFEVF